MIANYQCVLRVTWALVCVDKCDELKELMVIWGFAHEQVCQKKKIQCV